MTGGQLLQFLLYADSWQLGRGLDGDVGRGAARRGAMERLDELLKRVP